MLIVQLTDSHLVAEPHGLLYGLDPESSFEAALERIRKLPRRPDLILHTGDLTDDASEAGYERAHARLLELEIPYTWIPGNHDSVAGMSAVLTPPRQAFEAGGWQWILINSKIDAPDTHDGAVSESELEFLLSTLQRTTYPTIVVVHHHPIPVYATWLDRDYPMRNQRSFVRLLEQQPHCRVVLFGHVHHEVDRTEHGIRFLGAPSTCEQFLPGSQTFTRDPRYPGFRVVEIGPGGEFETHVVRYPFDQTVS